MDVTSRQRPLALLVAVVLAQILLLAFQIKRERDVSLIRVWSVELLTPLESAGTYVISKVSGIWTGYIGLRHTETENQRLRAELARLQLSNQQLEGQAAEAARLARLLGFRQENPGVQMVVAEVIGASADSSSHTIFINRGDREGLRRNMAVITPDGVVGKISEVSPHVAQVLLITDKESGVGALLADSRAHGVIDGTGEPLLQMEFVRGEEKVSLGEKIVTSGEDRIFPKDLPLGTVESTKAGLPFQMIQVDPAAHLDRLEEVFVLLMQQPLNLGQSGSTNASANEEISPAAQAKPNGAPKSQASPDGKQPQTKPGGTKPGGTKPPSGNLATPAKKSDGGAKPSGGPGRIGANLQGMAI
ncbi:MAG TPA: rod shape-determining protein MreC [Candidatus Acidoferrales bacterium]|nr:rod shape-determining protein MreC [Candidatus Acidoferrales bacterium]